MMEKTLIIEGMMCSHCVMHVQQALSALPGVSEVTVNLEEKSAHVKLEQNVADKVMKNAVAEAGYKVTEIK